MFKLTIIAIAFMLAGCNGHPAHMTKYQSCVEDASHLRSDEDTKMWKDNVCNSIMFEDGDLR